ncbi:MAG TPA: T9SS type A sorting domain-containing protein [Bacteroidia bacterium]|jgi:hypothetical protein|nr:T9SS type A sorting domain-containing protein [Bacteroidia bacterium]
MKTKLIAIISIFLIGKITAQENFPFLYSNFNAFNVGQCTPPTSAMYDSIHYWQTDSSNVLFLGTKAKNIHYDANKNLTEITYYNMPKGYRSTYYYAYNSKNKLTSHLLKSWDDKSVLLNARLTTNTYTNDNLTETIEQTWNVNTNSWDNAQRYVNTYDNSGFILTNEIQGWNNASWYGFSKTLFAYNPDHTVREQTHQFYQGSQWYDGSKDIFTYDANKNPVLELRYSGTLLMDSLIREFNGKNEMSRKFFRWDAGIKSWVAQSQSTNTHNSNGNILSLLFGEMMNGVYTPLSHYHYYYNASNQLTDESAYNLNPQPYMADSIHYFINPKPNGINENLKNSISIYPNPSNGTFNLQVDNSDIFQTIEVYNMLGECILRQHFSSAVTIPNAETGIYFVKISNADVMYTTKIIVQ